MSVLESIRGVADTLNEYLARVGSKNASASGTEDLQKGWTADILHVTQSLSEIPQQSWSKQVDGLSLQDEQKVVQAGHAEIFTMGENASPALTDGDRTTPLSTNPHQSNQGTPTQSRTDNPRASNSITYLSAPAADRLNMDGFAKVKDLLQNYTIATASHRKKPYMCLGDLGIVEGWTSILTNAAYCYENTPALGWRREVAIRMSGKSKGNTDIHYVTPDKRRRFRSRQELHTYMSRNDNSMSFLNAFDFRSVFCVCHEPEDSSRSYLECSYGLGGCNRWLHPECLGLGSRSEQELALMPKVICPYCAAYLKGAGEFDSFVTPDMHVYEAISQPPPDEEGESNDEIEASEEAHLLWGLQGSPFVFCSHSGASGLDAPDSSGYEDSAAGYNEYNANSASPAQPRGIPELQQDETNKKLPQHRLFQVWGSTGISEGDKGTPTKASSGSASFVVPVPAVAVIHSDDDEGVPSNALNLSPRERTRRARHADGSTTLVRVTGGWMPKRRLEGETDSSELPSATVSADETATAAAEAEDMKQRILAKAAARKAASLDSAASAGSTKATSVLAQRYKEEIIEAAIATAKSSSHRPKHSFDVVRLGNALVAAVEPLPSTVLTELREVLHTKPSLAYLPMEDGGLRYGIASCANVPRSLHVFCMANLMCGVCLTSTDNDLIQLDASAHAYAPIVDDKDSSSGKNKTKKAKKSHGDIKERLVDPELDRFNLVPISCGVVTYSAHKQCAHDVNGTPPLPSSQAAIDDFESFITLGEVYQYEQVDDNDCDLCGRKGGLMRYFTLSAKCSSVAAPNEEGWLAHLSCINFLSNSGLLRPISSSQMHGFSNRVGWRTIKDTAMEVTAAESKTSLSDEDNQAHDETRGNSSNDSTSNEEELSAEVRLAAALLEEDRLHPRAALSRFDQVLGQHRCALCGLQCGVALRCAAAGCGVRAHPLCVQACADPAWQVFRIEPTALSDRGALTLLCSLHSVDYLQGWC